MTERAVCAVCGAALPPGARFCQKCGETVTAASPAFAPPAARPTSSPLTLILILAAVPILILLLASAAGLWFYWRGGQKPPQIVTPPSGTGSSPTTPPGPDSPSPSGSLSDLAGRWVVMGGEPGSDAKEQEFELRVEDGKLMGELGRNLDRLELTEVTRSKLKGECYTDEQKIPAEAEVSEDRRQMTLTLAPPASEYVVIVARRPKEGESAPDGSRPPSSASDLLTEEQAVEKVREVAEVKEWLAAMQRAGKPPHIVVDREEEGSFIVQVYEIVEDGPDQAHTATMGWYRVNRRTGKVTSEM